LVARNFAIRTAATFPSLLDDPSEQSDVLMPILARRTRVAHELC